MKIHALGMHTEPARGGVDRYFSGLLDGLSALGIGIAAAAFGPADPARPGLLSLGPDDIGLRRRFAAIRRFAAQSGPSALFTSHFALYAFPLLLRLRGRPHVVHFHGPWAIEAAREHEKPWTIAAKYLVERAVYSSARRIIVLSPAFRDILTSRYGIDSSRISIIPGGIDLHRFHPMDQAAARRRLGWPSHARIIFCVRRLVHRMGLEPLLEALASVPDATLVIGGTGPLEDRLRLLARSLGLGRRVIFTGFIPDTDLPSAYAAADLTIVPSESLEGFGLVALESLACGRPALVTPVGGLPGIVAPLDPSLVLHGSLASGLAHALSRPALLPSAAQCRERAAAFAWPAIARRVLHLYEEASHE